jgi:hypothetical protein
MINYLTSLVYLGHSGNLLGMLQSMQSRQEMCDVIVVIKDVEFHAHRLILCSVSNFFRLRLQCESTISEAESKFSNPVQGIEQTTGQRLLLDNCRPESFQSLLNAIYSGQLKTDMNLLPDILRLANKLEMSLFVEACAEFLVESLSIRNARAMLHLGHSSNLPILLNAAQKVS